MSRSPTKQTDEPNEPEKEKKKNPPRKRHPSGTWPCKINGCNKEFAREADLKRHQRTTKLHSSSSLNVICPQCHGTFTRTDALRRHQKSRHNGIILDPIIPEDYETQQPSRSGSPMMGRLKLRINLNPTNNPLAAGPLSYYRSHVLPAEAFSALRPTMSVPPPAQSNNNNVVTHLPTSAARLHGASWPPAPPWMQEGSTGQPSSSNNPLPNRHFTPGTYYRSTNPDGSESLTDDATKQEVSQESNSEVAMSSGDIDPSLSTESPAGAHTNDSSQASFNESGDLNFAVQKALQAVLSDSIDPSLSVAVPSDSTGASTDTGGQLLSSSADAVTTEDQDSINATDIVLKALVNGDGAMEGISNGQDTGLHLNEPLSASDVSALHPDELLNEDSLSLTTTL